MNHFTHPSMDWITPGDLHNRFKLFKQKCQLVFDGPLTNKDDSYKVRLLLLWAGDKGLEIYNTAKWEEDGDKLDLEKVFDRLESYTKPQSNHILARFQLRSLKQGTMTLEEFVNKARLLINDGGYPTSIQDETLRDTLVFGLSSDRVRKQAIEKGNSLTLQQVYELAKMEESTTNQMKIITQAENGHKDIHAVRSKNRQHVNNRSSNMIQSNKQTHQQLRSKKYTSENRYTKPLTRHKKCLRCGGEHSKDLTCPAKDAKCNYCSITGHFERVCLKKKKKTPRLHQITEKQESRDDYSGDDEINDEHFFLGSIDTQHGNTIQADVTINNKHDTKIKIDTGADADVITLSDLQAMPFTLDIHPCKEVLLGYGGNKIHHLGYVTLQVTYKDRTITTKFYVVTTPDNPSVLGCKSSLELGIVSFNQHAITKTSKVGQLTKQDILQDYKECFDRIGRFPGEKYHIHLRENAKPVIHPPRTVPVHILPLYKAELEQMIKDDIITEVTEPTDWVNSIVCNVKDTPLGKKVRLCLDPRDLNKSIRREHHPTRTIDEILPLLHGKKYFSVVDTKKGYWHVELDLSSSLLCTFNTPFGRYRFKRLPFGVIVSQDIFQRNLDNICKDLNNVTGIADDIIVFGATSEEHDQAFIQLLESCKANNICLNSGKLQFKQQEVNFYGHTLTAQGLKPAADKLEAIRNIKTPEDAKELHTIMGIITYLNRFSSKLSDITKPLRELLKKNVHFQWNEVHQRALDRVKEELCKAQVLSYYNPSYDTTTVLQCDASKSGVGAWIRQIDDKGEERIIGMSSRSLTDTESRYSNIERECLAVMYGLEKFEYYLLGRHTIVETDHSPLEQIFKKNICEAPARLQRMLMRCLRFDITVQYKPGKTIPVADALSRVCSPRQSESQVQSKTINFMDTIRIPIDMTKLKEATEADPVLSKLKSVIYNGWPTSRRQCPQDLWEYWTFRCDLIIDDSLILKGDRIVIPQSLRATLLEMIHNGHPGETKSILKARESIYWPGINNDIKDMVKKCELCNKYQPAQHKLPIMQPDLSTRPWEQVGADLFEYKGSKYLLVVDYYSRFPIIRLLCDISANTVCNHMTSIFAEYGLPTTIIADCGTQFMSEAFTQKCKNTGIKLLVSSPYHHQANGVAERAVGTVKSIIKKALEESKNPYAAIWNYRTTPLDHNLPSPYEILFGRKPRLLLPQAHSILRPKHTDYDQHLRVNEQRQDNQAHYYNMKTGYDMRPMRDNEPAYSWNTLRNTWEPVTVVNRPDPDGQPRTYNINNGDKILQRTREHLKPRATQSDEEPLHVVQPESPERNQAITTNTQHTTRSGRIIKPPERLTL